MARPKRNADEVAAYDRLRNAFWDMLAEGSYRDITISAICRRAGVNHNTLYYYFDGLDDMAGRFFEENAVADMPRMVLGLLQRHEPIDAGIATEPDMELRFRRACLFAQSESHYLTELFCDFMRSIWLSALAIDENALSASERIDLDFIFGGITAALKNADLAAHPEAMRAIASRDLGKGILETLSGIAERHGRAA